MQGVSDGLRDVMFVTDGSYESYLLLLISEHHKILTIPMHNWNIGKFAFGRVLFPENSITHVKRTSDVTASE